MKKLSFISFKVWEVIVPVRADVLGASMEMASWPVQSIHLVEGKTSEGFTAVGECARGTPAECVNSTLRALLGINLLGVTPPTAWMQSFDPGQLPAGYPVWTKGEGQTQQKAIAEAVGMTSLYPVWSWGASGSVSYILFESLWLDAVGKYAGMPSHQLLGGAVRGQVAVDFWAARPLPDTLPALVHEAKEKGLRGMKIKSNDAGDAVLHLHQLRGELPVDFRFTIDAMCGWRSWRESQHLWKRLGEFPFSVQVEDPFPYENREDWRKVGAMNIVPLICHARSEQILKGALSDNLADAYNIGGGSAFEFVKLAAMAEFHGKDCWHGSGMELGVLQALHLHAASCARNCVLAGDLQSEWIRAETLVRPRMTYQGNGALVTKLPGLGVELDPDAVSRYRCSDFSVL